jgi:hypothetical protein
MLALVPALKMEAITDLFIWRSAASDGSGWDAAAPADFFFDDISISKTAWPANTTSVANQSVSLISVYPNPAGNVITVNGLSSLQAKVISLTGQVVKSVNQKSNQLNVSDLHKGIYFLSGKSEGNPYILKFIKN